MNEYKRERDTGQQLALVTVYNAVRSGKLINLKKKKIYCVDCKIARATDYDHRDYNYPLCVEPVCRRCNLRRGPAIFIKKLIVVEECIICADIIISKNRRHKGLCRKCLFRQNYIDRVNRGYYISQKSKMKIR